MKRFLLPLALALACAGQARADTTQREPLADLACPPVVPADDNDVGESAEGRLADDGNAKTLPTIRVATRRPFGIDVEIRDGNPLFFPGNENAAASGNGPYPSFEAAKRVEDLSFEELVELEAERIGAAADGASQLVLRFRAPEPMRFESLSWPGPDEGGTFRYVRSGETCEVGDDHIAVAVYTPPTDFGKRSGTGPVEKRVGRAEARTVEIVARFVRTTAQSYEDKFPVEKVVEIELVRPPVVLVHGLFDNAVDAWLTPTEVGQTLPRFLDMAGLEPFLVDYSASSGRAGGGNSSFRDNRHVLWTDGARGWIGTDTGEGTQPLGDAQAGEQGRGGGIRHALDYFRRNLKIAATKADVIGHSMGGVLSRVYASDELPADARFRADCGAYTEPYNPDYRRPDNFGQGDINRLITVGTPHHGSGQSEALELLTTTKTDKESWLGAGTESWETWGVKMLAGYGVRLMEAVSARSKAVQDLKLQSCALRAIGATKVPSHLVAAVTHDSGTKDAIHDPEREYLKTLNLVGALFFYVPEILDDYFEIIAKDWDSPVADEIKGRLRRDLDDLLDAELEFWAAAADAEGNLNRDWIEENGDRVPYAALEALRKVMFRFDRNDSTVRLDSQHAGLGLASPFVTHVENVPEADIKRSMLHRFTIRAAPIQIHLVDLLRSGSDRFAPELPPAGQRMPGKKPPKDFGVDWQLTGEFAVKWSGLVPAHANAFRDVADKHNVIIMNRPVNPDATALIAANAATKSMNVKGKSSNWGPQKGFIPVKQRYSKLWRNYDGKERDDKVKEFDDITAAMLAGAKDAYIHPETGKVLAIGRQLELRWPRYLDPRNEDAAVQQRRYTVWQDPDEKKDAEDAVFLCRSGSSQPAPADACACNEGGWFDWRTRDGAFDLSAEPSKPLASPDCKALEPLEVLADNTHPDLPYLTADYDILAFGFHCPNGARSADTACLGQVVVTTDPEATGCEPPTRTVNAFVANHMRPDPMPCFDPQTGLITQSQKGLLIELNTAVTQDADYAGGNVSHHGPETQFFKSPYVDYPITVFEPRGEDAEPKIIAIPKGPPGFRDLHLKRYYERKIRQGYWLYPNTYATANWKWQPRGTDAKWRGWHYADHESLKLGEDAAEIEPPACVKARIEWIRQVRRGETPKPPEPSCDLESDADPMRRAER